MAFDDFMDRVVDSRNFFAVLILSISLLVVVVCISAVASYRVSVACLAAGFPSYAVTLSGGYCVKRVNQTDVVVPLREVKRGF